eukprot:g47639.t1
MPHVQRTAGAMGRPSLLLDSNPNPVFSGIWKIVDQRLFPAIFTPCMQHLTFIQIKFYLPHLSPFAQLTKVPLYSEATFFAVHYTSNFGAIFKLNNHT